MKANKILGIALIIIFIMNFMASTVSMAFNELESVNENTESAENINANENNETENTSRNVTENVTENISINQNENKETNETADIENTTSAEETQNNQAKNIVEANEAENNSVSVMSIESKSSSDVGVTYQGHGQDYGFDLGGG